MRALYLSLLISTVFLVGCVPKPKVVEVKPKELPSWFLVAPANTTQTLYGVGEGKKREDAINAALNNLITQLSVTIESTYESEVKASNHSYSKESKQNIKSEVAKIRLSSHKVEKFEKIKYNQSVAMVSVQRTELYNSLKKELDSALELQQSIVSGIDKESALQQYIKYKKVVEALDSIESKLIIVSILNPTFDDSAYRKFMIERHKGFETSRDALVFALKSDSASKELVPVIKEGINNLKFQVSDRNDAKAVVEVTSQFAKSESMGFFIVNAIVNFKTVSDGKIVGSNVVKLKGSTTQNYDVAKQNAILKLKQQLEEEGIASFLGVEL
jgi:hypothetical protein